MKKKFAVILVVLTALLVLFAGCGSLDYNTELVKNGDFESYDETDKKIVDWQTYTTSNATFSITKDNTGADQDVDELGKQQLLVSSSSSGISYLYQKINVEAGKTYKLTARIKGNISSNSSSSFTGAKVGFLEDPSFMRIHVRQMEEEDGWNYYVVYINPEISTLTLTVGIGDTNANGSGTAYFDNISLTKIDPALVPADETVVRVSDNKYSNRNSVGGNVVVALLTIFAAALCCGAYILLRKYINQKKEPAVYQSKAKSIFLSPAALLSYVMVFALALRILLVNFVSGNGDTMSTLGSIALGMAKKGPMGMYAVSGSSMVSPGYGFILWAIGGIASLLGAGAESASMAILLRIPPLLCDILLIYVVFVVGNKFWNLKTATIVAGMTAALPALFSASGLWGTFDSVFALALVLIFMALLNKNYLLVAILSLTGLLFDARVLLLLPLIIIYLGYVAIHNKKERIKIPCYLVGGIVLFYLITLPFSWDYVTATTNGNAFYMFGKYAEILTANHMYAYNAFNMYALFGLNAVKYDTVALVFTYIFYLAALGFSTYIYMRNKDRLQLLLAASMIFVVHSIIAVDMTPGFMLGGLMLLLLYAIVSGERRTFKLFGCLSTLFSLNMLQSLNISGYLTNASNSLTVPFDRADPVIIVFSLVAMVLAAYFVYLVYDITIRGKMKGYAPLSGGLIACIKDWFKRKIDYLKKVKQSIKSA